MFKINTLRTTGLMFAAASTLAVAAPAFAQSADQGASVRVNYSDLNLAQAQGLAELKSRVHSAAVTACGGQVDIRDLDRRAVVEQCRTIAEDHAMSQVGAAKMAYAGATSPGR
jgi:UrcA family protein